MCCQGGDCGRHLFRMNIAAKKSVGSLKWPGQRDADPKDNRTAWILDGQHDMSYASGSDEEGAATMPYETHTERILNRTMYGERGTGQPPLKVPSPDAAIAAGFGGYMKVCAWQARTVPFTTEFKDMLSRRVESERGPAQGFYNFEPSACMGWLLHRCYPALTIAWWNNYQQSHRAPRRSNWCNSV